MPNTIAVSTPLRADGISRWRIVCQRVVPRAREPVLTSCGTARKASYDTLVIVGRIMIERTSDPASHEKPVWKPGMLNTWATTGSEITILWLSVDDRNGTRIVMPSHPQTTLGMPTK